MTERKFTDEEVIKALECCVKDDIIDSSNHEICFECPLKYDNDCSCNLRKRILDLINRQKAEIETLENRIFALLKGSSTPSYSFGFPRSEIEQNLQKGIDKKDIAEDSNEESRS
jgi:hypothetical protein